MKLIVALHYGNYNCDFMVTLAILLPHRPEGIAIRRVCWLVLSFVGVFVNVCVFGCLFVK